MKRTWKVLLVCVVAVAALAGYFFLLPAPAGGEDFQLLEVRQDGRDLTASLRPEQLADLEATMRGASRFRWKNPVGVYPLEADTVMLLGANGESVILVGSQGRFARLSPARRGDPAGGGSEHPRILIHFAYR